MKKTRTYSSILATEEHMLVTDLKPFRKKYSDARMGFYLNGKVIGRGNLQRPDYVRPWKGNLQTESVRLREAFRRKGHGIPLYTHLIETARRLGAKRIYSSDNLNKFSRNMWKNKLSKIYEVHPVMRRKCASCSCKTAHEIGYFIELT